MIIKANPVRLLPSWSSEWVDASGYSRSSSKNDYASGPMSGAAQIKRYTYEMVA